MSGTMSFLYGENIPTIAFLSQSAQWKSSVLGVLCFSKEAGFCADAGGHGMPEPGVKLPCVQVPMRRLGVADENGAEAVCEVWHGRGHLKQGQCGDIQYRHDGEVLFGVIKVHESSFAASADNTPLQQATESVYRQIFALLDKLNYPHLFRFWNYIADINGHSFGLERYRQFNLGRQDAFLAYGRDVVGNVPAACALGFAPDFEHGSLTIAFLAGQVAPIAIENPRQVSAYQYPQQYGPRSPTFARATLVQLRQSEVLFISGTASIVGHETLHPANVVVQTRETMANIEAVLAEANRVVGQPGFCLSDLHYRVYVRHPEDLKLIQAELASCVGSLPKAVYLQAEVCRQDLLLEIEATAEHSLLSTSTRV